MLDNQHRQILGQRCDGVGNQWAFAGRHTGGGLVQDQDARPQGQRHRHFHQALLAIGQPVYLGVTECAQLELRQQRLDLGLQRGVGIGAPDHARGQPAPLQQRQAQVFAHRQAAKQGGDLKGFGNPRLHPLRLAQPPDVAAVKADFPAGRREDAGDEVGEGRFPGPVRPDQRLAVTGCKIQRDVARHHQPAERLVEVAHLKALHRAPPVSFLTISGRPNSPAGTI
ncbi:hypothetical protein GALL_513200 [mine drainage metagenome]|uniref:Uncharacterized protein n=1 Tax=mine drainage metagenome TaxID=410659 RepID=A0A1J5P6C1_9ZZZZ